MLSLTCNCERFPVDDMFNWVRVKQRIEVNPCLDFEYHFERWKFHKKYHHSVYSWEAIQACHGYELQ